MQTQLHAFLAATAALFTSGIQAETTAKPEPQERAELAALFEKQGVAGTIAVADLQTGKLWAHDAKRAATRFIPASTFKIPNSLIALGNGAVANVDEMVPYGGKPQFLPEWEHDMPMREAIAISAVPIYQELARRVGLERMAQAVKTLEYGNAAVGKVVDRFWLDGPLEISALAQIDFLTRLLGDRLPAKPEHAAAVREITLLEKTPEFELHGKMGWCFSSTPNVGWFVGWVEKSDRRWVFALNIDMTGKDDAAKRVPLAKACLTALGVLPK